MALPPMGNLQSIMIPQDGSFCTGFSPEPQEPTPPAMDDTGLTVLVDVCRNTMATVGGDGYDEIVLYRNDQTGEYSLHTYRKYVYMEAEEHRSYPADEAVCEAVFDEIRQQELEQYENQKGFGACGGNMVCKFRKGDRLICITTDNLGMDGFGRIGAVNGRMRSFCNALRSE